MEDIVVCGDTSRHDVAAVLRDIRAHNTLPLPDGRQLVVNFGAALHETARKAVDAGNVVVLHVKG